MKVLTEAILRYAKLKCGDVYYLEPDTLITPAAKEYASDHGIKLQGQAWKEMSQTPIDEHSAFPYVDAQSGIGYTEKPEAMTHLYANRLVKKTHPQIAFRGQLDVLQAEVIVLQTLAYTRHKNALLNDLDELLGYLRTILAAEVKEQPLPPLTLMGMDEKALRWASHHVEESVGIRHPVPDYRMGEVCVKLNYLRARARQAELAAAHAFADGSRRDLLLAMNRLSSAIHILFCREVKAGTD